jgi:hypothetical protein
MERTLVWMLDRYPWFKSMMARGIYSGAEPIATGAGATAGALVGHQSGKKE